MKNSDLKVIEYILRVGISLTFFGHGILAISGKPDWFPYLKVVGMPIYSIQKTLFLIGILDILVAFFLIFKPFKPVLIWAMIWTFSTAIIRPISGEPIWSFVERGAVWLAPIALYTLMRYKLVQKNGY